MARKYPDNLTGRRFGKWLVLSESTDDKCLCRCDCGNEKRVNRYSLLRGSSKCCGCTKINDLNGQRFGMLTVLRFDHQAPRYGLFWLCRCDCGKEKVIRGSDLMKGTASCGCKQREGRRINDIGERYGRLVVMAFRGQYRDCVCDCGNTVTVLQSSLRTGKTRSCGCLHKETISKLGAAVGVKNCRDTGRYDWHVKINGKRIDLRSSFEVIFAKYLIKHRIRFEYEPERIQLDASTIYIPDFYLPDSDTWVEVKGWASAEWLRKRTMFERTGRHLLVVTDASINSYLDGIRYKTWMKRNKHKYLHP